MLLCLALPHSTALLLGGGAWLVELFFGARAWAAVGVGFSAWMLGVESRVLRGGTDHTNTDDVPTWS